MPDYPHIDRYHRELAELIEFGGVDNEENIRAAFQYCLSAYCADHSERLALVPELRSDRSNKPDGTVRDSLRMTRGLWEAKDTHDDLDREIRNKLAQGYPGDNILFENSRTAVLFQDQREALRVDMTNPAALDALVRQFLNYELPEIQEFRQARQQFKDDLPAVLANLRETIVDAEAGNPRYQEAAQVFLELCHQSISTAVTNDNVREMLIQHILTKDIFLRVFAEDQFHRENNVARQLDALEGTFFTGSVRRQAVDRLRAYYGAIGRAADDIAEYGEKQQFLKGIYEDFYQAYNPGAADRLGVVYTPNEVVDFIIRGADWLLQKHFGKTLADPNVHILDPATGTGTFITNLMRHLPADRLEHKYRKETHANEVEILPYYIANLNVEYTYKELTGKYLEFPNLCFVDTLDNMDWQGASGAAVQRQTALNLGGVSEENWIRVQEQNEKPISVIIGNPPYNANQQNENDNNKNRAYPAIDRRIRETYIAASTAQKTKQYDMYKRFIRWASDRLNDDGVIAFVTNRSYIDSRQDDGFRKIVVDEFSDLYIVDLGGDIRKNGRVGNVFGIMTGVAVGFLVRRSQHRETGVIHYHALVDAMVGDEKLSALQRLDLSELTFQEIKPDAKGNWLDQSDSGFEQLLPLANRETKLAKSTADERAVFGLNSLGIATNRDEWTYDFDYDALSDKVLFFTRVYRDEMRRFNEEGPDPSTLNDWVDRSIKWTSELESHLVKGDPIDFATANITSAIYRPFVTKHCYYAPIVTHRRYQMPQIFPHQRVDANRAINFAARHRSFYVLASDKLVDLHFVGDNQCLPLYRYTADGERVSNITEWGLRQFREHYGDDGISAADIFAYTYAMLHDPAYRQRYEVDLRREFPRVYFQEDFAWWAQQGRELLDLHLGFETAEPWPLERVDSPTAQRVNSPTAQRVDSPTAHPEPVEGRAARAILRADQEKGIIQLDDRTALAGVPPEAWEYRLGNRSALEWVLDQYKERKPRDPTIAERFNTYRFADHKELVIELLARVCAVSAFTTTIVNGLGRKSSIKHG